jgi:hypothetical protein
MIPRVPCWRSKRSGGGEIKSHLQIKATSCRRSRFLVKKKLRKAKREK